VHVDRFKTRVESKAPTASALKLEFDKVLSTNDFNFNLRRCSEVVASATAGGLVAVQAAATLRVREAWAGQISPATSLDSIRL
jgi:hypothetical protein